MQSMQQRKECESFVDTLVQTQLMMPGRSSFVAETSDPQVIVIATNGHFVINVGTRMRSPS